MLSVPFDSCLLPVFSIEIDIDENQSGLFIEINGFNHKLQVCDMPEKSIGIYIVQN